MPAADRGAPPSAGRDGGGRARGSRPGASSGSAPRAASTSASVCRSSTANSAPRAAWRPPATRRRGCRRVGEVSVARVGRLFGVPLACPRPSARSLRASGCRSRPARPRALRPRQVGGPSPVRGRRRGPGSSARPGPKRRSTNSIASRTPSVGIGAPARESLGPGALDDLLHRGAQQQHRGRASSTASTRPSTWRRSARRAPRRPGARSTRQARPA